jgi:hypothetical protein
MHIIVSILSSLTLGIGVYGLVSPAGMKSLVSHSRSQAGFRTAILFRLILGIALWRVAPASRTPEILQALGLVSGASALVLAALGLSRYQAMLSWWSNLSNLRARAWSIPSIAVGAFILWSIH